MTDYPAQSRDIRQPASAQALRRAISDRQGGAFAANVFRRADA
jgi:hypothetical protein